MGPQVRRHLTLAAWRGTSSALEVVTAGMGDPTLRVFREARGSCGFVHSWA